MAKTKPGKADKILAHARRGDAIDQAADHARRARIEILVAIDALLDIEEKTPCGALRGALPELDRALYVLRRMRGDVNRAIANTARAADA